MSNYLAEITFPDGNGYDECYPTLREAVAFIEFWALGRGFCAAWINNKKLNLRNGLVVDCDGYPLCTVETYHRLFADCSERIPEVPNYKSIEEAFRGYKPRHARNPATLAQKGIAV